MSWSASLELDYRRCGDRTIALDRHEGPLRVLQRLYPEGDAVCHHVMVHPPGGVAGGDVLEVKARLDSGTHALLTTPGATRFYRTEGEPAVQRVTVHLAEASRLEWVPLETLVYDGCIAENRLQLNLRPGAQALGWDLLALGLPAAGAPFRRGRFVQHLQCGHRWLERGCIDAADSGLMDGPLGFDGRRMMALMWFVAEPHALSAHEPPDDDDALLDALLQAAREVLTPADGVTVGAATRPVPGVVTARVLAHRVEPAFRRLRAIRDAWRQIAWGLPPHTPRVWST